MLCQRGEEERHTWRLRHSLLLCSLFCVSTLMAAVSEDELCLWLWSPCIIAPSSSCCVGVTQQLSIPMNSPSHFLNCLMTACDESVVWL